MVLLCDPGDSLQQLVKKEYGEILMSQGVGNRGFLFQLWQNNDAGNWSLLLVDPRAGMTCLVAAGDEWMLVGKVPVW